MIMIGPGGVASEFLRSPTRRGEVVSLQTTHCSNPGLTGKIRKCRYYGTSSTLSTTSTPLRVCHRVRVSESGLSRPACRGRRRYAAAATVTLDTGIRVRLAKLSHESSDAAPRDPSYPSRIPPGQPGPAGLT